MRAWSPLPIVLVLALSGCLAVDPSGGDGENADLTDEGLPWQRLVQFKGSFLLPEEGASQAFTFEVPNGTAEVEGLLTWNDPGARLSFRLVDAAGEEAARGWHERDGRAYVTNTHPPAAGLWSVEVIALAGLGADFTMDVALRSVAVPHGAIETTFQVPARNPARELPDELSDLRGPLYQQLPRDFAEINLNMVPGDWFTFSWSADAELYFNVHYHPEEGGTERAIETRARSLEGEFTADWTEVYALLWRNENLQPVALSVTMDGVYRLHSMSRDV